MDMTDSVPRKATEKEDATLLWQSTTGAAAEWQQTSEFLVSISDTELLQDKEERTLFL